MVRQHRKYIYFTLFTIISFLSFTGQVTGQDSGALTQGQVDVLNLLSSLQGAAAGGRYKNIPQSRTEDGAFVLGYPEAPITIVAFEDFLCPHCQNYEPTIQQLIDEHVMTGKARFEYRMFPVVDPVYSLLAAQLVECADKMLGSGFWTAHDKMFELATAERFANSTVVKFADALGLDYEKLANCTEDASQASIDTELAHQVGAMGTPAVMVRYGNGRLQWIVLDGQTYNRGGVPIEVLQRVIEEANVGSVSVEISVLNNNWLHDRSLLTGDPCRAPCWYGITPGETRWDEALEIIRASSNFTGLEVQGDDLTAARSAAWQEIGGEPCCDMFSTDGQVVDSILLRLSPVVRLGEVIEIHGEPTYVVGTEVVATEAVMTVFYIDPPMLIYVFVAGANVGALSESSEIIGVLYMARSTMTQLIEVNALHTWEGYQSYQYYAQRPFEVTPVP